MEDSTYFKLKLEQCLSVIKGLDGYEKISLFVIIMKRQTLSIFGDNYVLECLEQFSIHGRNNAETFLNILLTEDQAILEEGVDVLHLSNNVVMIGKWTIAKIGNEQLMAFNPDFSDKAEFYL